ncbi:hypothetical protein GCM10028778_18220 [Barrientosiimonas marina]
MYKENIPIVWTVFGQGNDIYPIGQADMRYCVLGRQLLTITDICGKAKIRLPILSVSGYGLTYIKYR